MARVERAQEVPRNCMDLSAKLHGVTYQFNIIVILNAVRTINLKNKIYRFVATTEKNSVVGPNRVLSTWRRRQNPVTETLCFKLRIGQWIRPRIAIVTQILYLQTEFTSVRMCIFTQNFLTKFRMIGYQMLIIWIHSWVYVWVCGEGGGGEVVTGIDSCSYCLILIFCWTLERNS
jgi:hypothetical protein